MCKKNTVRNVKFKKMQEYPGKMIYICTCIKSLPRGAPTEQPEATVVK